MRIPIVIILVVLLLPLGLADLYKRGDDILISQGFSVGGAVDGNLDVNMSFTSPNRTVLIPWTNMSFNSDSGKYEFLIDDGNITDSGSYCAMFSATNGVLNETEEICYDITSTGRDFGEGGGMAGLGLIAGAIGVAFFFMIFGFKFSQGDGTRPLGLFFGVLAIIMILYSLHLGLSYSVAMFDYDPFSSTQTAIYNSALYLLSGVGVISFILMTIAMVREFGKGKMMKDFGEGFDPITQTYN